MTSADPTASPVPPATLVTTSPATTTENTILIDKAECKLVAYAHFRQKFRRAVKLEFKNAGIHCSSALGAMWKQHKTFIAISCNEGCPCAFQMKVLSASVIRAMLEKEGGWLNPMKLGHSDMPVGFMTSFAGKIMPLLRTSYPDESPGTILQRLISCWMVHTRLRTYGARCTAECKCQDAWTNEFKKGDLKLGWTMQLKTQPKHALVSSNYLSMRAAPRKKIRGPYPMDEVSATDGPPLFGQAVSNSRQKAALATGLSQYFVAFKTSEPLGFYCVPGYHGGLPVCKIASIAPKGQCKSDKRIQAGTIITGATLNGYLHSIDNPTQLKSFFEADNHDTGLMIRFSNEVDSLDSTMEIGSSSQSNWTGANNWLGISVYGGWAGGALEESKEVPFARPIAGHAKEPEKVSQGTLDQSSNIEESGLGMQNSSSFSLICNAVEEYSLSELVKCFKRGHAATLLENEFERIRNQIIKPAHHMAASKFGESPDLVVLAQLRKLRLRDGLLEIFSLAAKLVHLSDNILNRKRVQCEIKRVSGIVADLQALFYPPEIFVTCQSDVSSAFEPLPLSLPFGEIRGDGDSKSRILSFPVGSDEFTFEISLIAKSVDSMMVQLGKTSLKKASLGLSGISEEGEILSLEISPAGNYLRSGAVVELLVLNVPSDRPLPVDQQHEIEECVQKTYELLEKFNEDLSVEVGGVFLALTDIKAGNGTLMGALEILGSLVPTASANLLFKKANSSSSGKKTPPISSVDLPCVGPEWVLKSANDAKMRCIYHERTRTSCSHRVIRSSIQQECQYIHIHRPWGPLLLESFASKWECEQLPVKLQQLIELKSNYVVLAKSNNEGILWYSAKYSRVLSGSKAPWQDVIFAEGGHCLINEQGVCWYTSEHEARTAAEKTAVVTFKAILKGRLPNSRAKGPFNLLPSSS